MPYSSASAGERATMFCILDQLPMRRFLLSTTHPLVGLQVDLQLAQSIFE